MSPIRVETGPMFSGKSEAITKGVKGRLIGRQVQGVDFLVFNHAIDKRYTDKGVATHEGVVTSGIALRSSKELLDFLFDFDNNQARIKPEFRNLRALYLDEAQFFDKDLGKVLQFVDEYFTLLGSQNFELVVCGLDMDFRGEPFGPMPDIVSRAHTVRKNLAVCDICGDENATRTQRLIDGQPANYNDEVISVGSKDDYTARCDKHHDVPGKKQAKLGELFSKPADEIKTNGYVSLRKDLNTQI